MLLKDLMHDFKKLKLKSLYFFRPDQLFNENFHLEQSFHGIQSHRVHESFTITPKSEMGIFMFYEDVQFMKLVHPSFFRVKRLSEKLIIEIQVNSERESAMLKRLIIKEMLTYFIKFVARFEQDEKIKYVARFCSGCQKYKSMPLNRCVMQCQFEPASLESKVNSHHAPVTAISAGAGTEF